MAGAAANKATGTTRSSVPTTRTAMPPVATVYRALDGALHHTRCARRMEFLGGRAGLELDFYCFTCCEHITLTPYVISRLPEPPAPDLTPAPAR